MEIISYTSNFLLAVYVHVGHNRLCLRVNIPQDVHFAIIVCVYLTMLNKL